MFSTAAAIQYIVCRQSPVIVYGIADAPCRTISANGNIFSFVIITPPILFFRRFQIPKIVRNRRILPRNQLYRHALEIFYHKTVSYYPTSQTGLYKTFPVYSLLQM